MKRLLGALVCSAMVSAAFAQAPFTVVSPRNYNPDTNSPLVREKIVLKFPKNSIPSTGYIGIFMGSTRNDKVENEKFIEATIPTIQGNSYVYTLDTKARNIPDGMYTIRAVLYVDYSDRPREISQTQVNVRVANKSSIKIPDSGIKLRYALHRGQELLYRVDVRSAVSTISARQNSLGGRAAELPLESEVLRMVYAVDDTYGNGDALIRMQPQPLAGKDYLYVILDGNTEPDKYYSYEMAPIYMRMSSTGQEIFGSIPDAIGSGEFVPLGAGGGVRQELYANFPLPSLPAKAVKPGDSWQTRFQLGALDLQNKGGQEHVVSKLPARGEFLDVEYERGHPCARLHHTIVAGTKTSEGLKLGQQGRDFTDDKVSIDETVWFALDTRKAIKVVRDITIDTKDQSTGTGFGGGGSGSGPQSPGGAPARSKPRPGTGVDVPRRGTDQQKRPLQPPSGGGASGPGSAGLSPGSPPGGGRQGFGNRGGNGASNPQLIRFHQQYIFTLEN